MERKEQIERLEGFLARMRAQSWGTQMERDERRHECWLLSGAIEDLTNGRTPVLEGSAKYLRWTA
jgi:hypothetical protein